MLSCPTKGADPDPACDAAKCCPKTKSSSSSASAAGSRGSSENGPGSSSAAATPRSERRGVELQEVNARLVEQMEQGGEREEEETGRQDL